MQIDHVPAQMSRTALYDDLDEVRTMAENKSKTLDRPLFILQYLIRNTDDDHKVSLNQLISVCRSSGHGGNRHTISNDIDILCHYGFDIICSKEGNKNTYSYGCRQFDTAELRMLMDAVGSSASLPHQKAEKLVRKIASISGNHEAEKLCSTVYVPRSPRTGNQYVFLTIDVIHQAINAEKKIRFQSVTLTGNRERVPQNGGAFLSLSPYTTVWLNDLYYVIGWEDMSCKLSSFRIDLMGIPQLTDEPAVLRPRDFNPDYYIHTLTTLCDEGMELDITLQCDDSMMGNMVDRFGDKFPFERADNHHFRATVHVNTGNAFWGWLFGFGQKIKIIGPDWAKSQYAERLQAALCQ